MKKTANGGMNMYNSRKASGLNPNLGLTPMKYPKIKNTISNDVAPKLGAEPCKYNRV